MGAPNNLPGPGRFPWGKSIPLGKTWRSTSYSEDNPPDDPSPQLDWGPEGATARRRIRIEWQWALLAKCDFLGYATNVVSGPLPGGQGGNRYFVSRVPPHQLNPFMGFKVLTGDGNAQGVDPSATRTVADRLSCVRFRCRPLQPAPTKVSVVAGAVQDYLQPDPANLPAGPQGQTMTPPDTVIANYVWGEAELIYDTLPYFVMDDAALVAQIAALQQAFYGSSDINVLGSTVTGPLYGLPDESWLLRNTITIPRPAGRILSTPQNFLFWVPETGDPAAFAGFFLGGNLGGVVPLTPINVGTPIYKPSIQLRISWMQVPDNCVPWGAMQKCLGGVNATPFDPFHVNAATGTVLFMGVDPQRVMLSDGQIGYNLTYDFLVAPNYDLGTGDGNPVFLSGVAGGMPTGSAAKGPAPRGWNALLQKRGPNIDYRYISAFQQLPGGAYTLGNPPYPFVDLRTLFRPPQTAPLF